MNGPERDADRRFWREYDEMKAEQDALRADAEARDRVRAAASAVIASVPCGWCERVECECS